MRAQSASREEFPATVVKAGMGYCSTHYSARVQRRSLPGDGKIDHAPATASERQEIASRWSETDRNAALAVCSFVTEPKEAFEVMSMLGLFDDDPTQITTDLLDPKGVASGRR